MSIAFKVGVDGRNVHPSIWLAVGVAYALYPRTDDMDVTSMNDGAHSLHSYHYPANTPSAMCQAVDLRTRDLAPEAVTLWFARIVSHLAPLGYDLVNHDGKDGLTPHIHVEWQPKANEKDIFKGVLK